MTINPKIPFVDLLTMHRQLGSDLLAVCARAIESGGFIGGPELDGFEHEFAEFCGTQYCVGVNSGTDALRFALIAAGIQHGDIALTVPNTFIATTEAITQAGGRPDLIDIDPVTFNMDPAKLQKYFETNCSWDSKTEQYVHKTLGNAVTTLVPVHLFGQMADMDPLMEAAERYRLTIVEDACQAHGAEYFSKKQNRWLKAGSIGRAAAFSFYPAKNLGACGEGGAITTNDQELARKCVALRDHGSSKKYYHDVEGYNGRLDSIQAGMLRVKLKHLSRWNEQRRESARAYAELLNPVRECVKPPYEPDYSKSVHHLYVVRTPHRDELQKHLSEAGVATGIHYPIPVHLQQAYAALGWKKGDFPESEEAANQILSLPMFAGLTLDQQKQIADVISQFVTALELPGGRSFAAHA